jgi:DNA primase
MPPFDDHIKEEVRSRSDIAAVIGRYVTLKGSGQTLKGLCPFHKEKTPSFHVNPVQGFFHCFGCGKGGDVFSFVQEMEGVSFPEALAMLAEECGVVIEQRQQTHSASSDYPEYDGYAPTDNAPSGELTKTDLLKIHEIAARFFYRNIRPSPAAVQYCKSRGLEPETVRDFKLGFAPESWTGLIDYCRNENISEEALVTCGLAIRKENGRCYDRFRSRVIFSLCDLSGRVIGFAGRGMEADAIPKYLNSPETQLYKKKHFLYGLGRSRQTIKEKGTVIIVEGYMDYLTLYQAGIRNVVASSGTALTPEHAQLLSRFTHSILLTFDGDNAGRTAAERAVFTLAPFNFDLSVLLLPPEDDPDSLVRTQGREAFESLLATAQTWSEFIIGRMITQHKATTPRGKSAVVDALAPIMHSLRDEIVAARFKKDIADQLGIEERLLNKKLSGGAEERRSRPSGSLLSRDTLYAGTLEGSFLRLLFAKPELIDEARNYVTPETLTDGISGDIYSLMIATYDRNHHFNAIIDSSDDPEIKRLLSFLMVAEVTIQNIHDDLVQKIVHLRKKYINSRIRECKLQMNREPHRRSELLQQLRDYMTQLHELDGGE